MSTTKGPLAGIRILDAATFLAAPYAASQLSEYGAEVIKVEQVAGDSMRRIAPLRGDVSVWWKVIARNRKSIALDLNAERGREIFLRLVAECDIVILNFRPSALRKWGLEFEDLIKVQQNLIYFHLTAFGEGPYHQRPGFARVAEAFAGLTNRTGFKEGPPVQSGYAMLGDGIAGIYGSFAIMLALRQRDLTGEPQKIDLGLYEPILSMMEDMIVVYDETGSRMERMGNSSPRWSPHGLFQTKDGLYAVIACSTEKLWRQLRALIGDETLCRYDDNSSLRVRERPELEGRIGEWALQYTLPELLELCGNAGLAIGAIYSAEEIINDPHIVARGSIITVADEETGKPIRFASSAGRFSGFNGEVRSLGPRVGEHSREILGRLLEYSEEEIRELQDRGIVG